MSDTQTLLTAFKRVEDALESKTSADEKRFTGIESDIQALTIETRKTAAIVSQHAELHTSHARMITKANEAATVALNREIAIPVAVKEQLNRLEEDGKFREALLSQVAKATRSPWFKLAWLIGGIIGGAIATYYGVK